jgi:hypothetical protein
MPPLTYRSINPGLIEFALPGLDGKEFNITLRNGRSASRLQDSVVAFRVGHEQQIHFPPDLGLAAQVKQAGCRPL